jgi:hypothetical protein
MAQRLIITNGDASVGACRMAETGDEHLSWLDVLYEGPVSSGLDLPALSLERADWIARQSYAVSRLAREQFAARDARLAATPADHEVVLLFEPDLHDQLQLAQLLDWFGAHRRPAGKLRLAQAATYISDLLPRQLAGLCETADAVDDAQYDLGAALWQAYREPTPEALAGLPSYDLTALPYVERAILRLLEELPNPVTGLSRTEWQIVTALRHGPLKPRDIFEACNGVEAAIFMSDWNFYAVIDRMAAWPAKLFKGHELAFNPNMRLEHWRRYHARPLELTPLGLEVVAAQLDVAAVNPVDRWLGGTHLTNGRLWRWDSHERMLLAP